MSRPNRQELANNSTLTPRQERGIAALLTSPTVESAAKLAGCGVRTLHTWLSQPHFAEAYSEARRSLVDQSVTRLQAACRLAVDALTTIVTNTQAAPSARIAAARVIIDTAIRGIEVENVNTRLNTLEVQMKVTRNYY